MINKPRSDSLLNIHKFAFISSLYQISDYGLFTAALWMLAANKGSTVLAGLAFSIAVFIPDLIRKKIHSTRSNGELFFPLLIKRRVISLMAFLLMLLGYMVSESMNIIYAALTILSIINLLTSESIESCFGYFAAIKAKDNYTISRVQQISAQVSMILGASISGFILQHLDFDAVLVFACFSTLLGLITQNIFRMKSSTIKDSIENETILETLNGIENYKNSFFILMLLILIISLFNFITPFMLKNDKLFTAQDYGLLEMYCVLGSLFALLFNDKFKYRILINDYSMIMVLLTAFMGLIFGQKIIVFVSGAMIGFSLNMLRIKQRSIIFAGTTNKNLALYWGKLLAKNALIIRSIIPLFIGCVLNIISPSKIILITMPMISCLMIVFSILQQRKTIDI